jgi:hypothetical protein
VEERRAAGKSSHKTNHHHGPSEIAGALKVPEAYVRGAIGALIRVEVYESKRADRSRAGRERGGADGLVRHDNPRWVPRVPREVAYTTAQMHARLLWYGLATRGQVPFDEEGEPNY